MSGGTFQMLKDLAQKRAIHLPLRYGRYYFREVSGDGQHFGHSMDRGGVFAFSRIHCDQEVLVVAYPNPFQAWGGWVEIDADLTADGEQWRIAFSTLGNGATPTATTCCQKPVRRALRVDLASNELQILVKA